MRPEEALRQAPAVPVVNRSRLGLVLVRLAVWLLRIAAALLLALPLLLLALWLAD